MSTSKRLGSSISHWLSWLSSINKKYSWDWLWSTGKASWPWLRSTGKASWPWLGTNKDQLTIVFAVGAAFWALMEYHDKLDSEKRTETIRYVDRYHSAAYFGDL